MMNPPKSTPRHFASTRGPMPDSHWNQGIILGRIRRPSTCMGCHENSALGFGLGGSGGDHPPPPPRQFWQVRHFCFAAWQPCGLQPCSLLLGNILAVDNLRPAALPAALLAVRNLLLAARKLLPTALQRATCCLQPCSLAVQRFVLFARAIRKSFYFSLTKTLACASESVPNLQPGSLQSGWAALAEDLSRGDVHCPVLQVGQLDNS